MTYFIAMYFKVLLVFIYIDVASCEEVQMPKHVVKGAALYIYIYIYMVFKEEA
jgi:hypothetical protein